MKQLIFKFYLVTIILIGTLGQSLAQQLQLGNLSYIRAEARSLARPVALRGSFFRAVGGVAFQSVAVGKDGLMVSGLHYDADNPDGERLVVTIQSPSAGKANAYGEIHDWQLIPIARFVNSDYESVMTLFGELVDEDFANQVTSEGGRVINYHDAFDNTLLGLRMLQADILIFQPQAADLFKLGESYLLGPGEPAHDVDANWERFLEMGDWLTTNADQGMDYQSYVVGDIDQTVSFDIYNEKMVFKGQPSWTMWRNLPQTNEDIDTMSLVYQYAELAERDANSLTESEEVELYRLESVIGLMLSAGLDLEAVAQRLDDLDWETAEVEILSDFSDATTKKVYQLQGINPVVYYNLEQVMHYSALFRHYKQQDPIGYLTFVTSLDGVVLTPQVETPTVQY